MSITAAKWGLCVAGAILAAPAAALALGPVSLRPQWRAGTEQRYDLSADYNLLGPDEQSQAARRRVSQSARLLVAVADADGAGGATLRLKFESFRTEVAGPENPPGEVFNWEQGQGEAGPDGPIPEGELSALARLSGPLVSCTITAAVAPDGSVTSVTGLGPLATALEQQGGDSAALEGLGFFSPARLASNLAMLWRIDPQGPAREVGARWRMTERLPMGGGFEAELTTAWTVTGIEGSTVSITGVTTMAPVAGKREPDPAAPRLEIKDQSGAVTAQWDAAAGVLIGRVENRAATWAASVDLGPGAATPTVAAEARAASRVEIRLVK